MSNINYESKNTVDSKGQVSQYVYFDGDMDGSPRVLIMGNSITRHSPLPEIGWYGDWGMAASSRELDYAHQLMAKIRQRCPRAVFCVVQGALWERSYRGLDFDSYYAEAKDFCPDIIVTAISANIPDAEFECDAFVKGMGEFHDYFGMTRLGAKLVQTSSFFNNERKSEAIKKYVTGRGGRYVYISDLPSDSSNLAIGLFEHDGVAHHPGDKGMREMAERIFEALKMYLD